MSAECSWSLTMTGRSRNKYLKEILAALYQIEKVDIENGEEIFGVSDGKNWFTNKVETCIYTDNSSAHNIWGENYLEPTEDFYVMIAKAAPKANWTISSERTALNGGDGSTSFMEAIYANGVLEFKTDCYVDWRTVPELISRMKVITGSDDNSFEAFCNFYHVDDSISVDDYDEFKDFDEMVDHDMGDDYYFNCENNSVSGKHLWTVKTIPIEE